MIGVTTPLWVGLLVGVAFGVPASIWGIGNPETVIRTARLVDRLLLGCFLFVTAVGSVLLYGLYAMGFAMHFSPRPVYLVGVTVGGLLFGAGAAISGYFPGTEMIALGEGRREVLFAIPGGLLGATRRFRYAYRLDGFDRDWIPAAADRPEPDSAASSIVLPDRQAASVSYRPVQQQGRSCDPTPATTSPPDGFRPLSARQ